MSTQKQKNQDGEGGIAEQAEEKELLDDLKAAQISTMQGVWGSAEDAVCDAL